MSSTTSNTETPSHERGTLIISDAQLFANQRRQELHSSIWYQILPDWMKGEMVDVELAESPAGLFHNSVIDIIGEQSEDNRKLMEHMFAIQLSTYGVECILSNCKEESSGVTINETEMTNKSNSIVGSFLNTFLSESRHDCCLTDPWLERLVGVWPVKHNIYSTRDLRLRKKMALLKGDKIKLTAFTQWINNDFHTFCRFSRDPSKTKLTVINF